MRSTNGFRCPASEGAAAPAGVLSALRRLRDDDAGAAMLEFILVLYAFLFVLLGVVQVGLMVTASYYTNYANFMAMRAASVYYEAMEDGFISRSDFEQRCEKAALYALGPMERYWWTSGDNDAESRALDRLEFKYEEGSDKLQDGRAASLKGRLEYDYRLIVPFVGRVISALGKGMTAKPGAPFAYDTEGMGTRYPTLKLGPNDELSDETSGSPPRYHEILVQRRWQFEIVGGE